MVEIFTRLVTAEDEGGKFLSWLAGALLHMIRSQDLYKLNRQKPQSGESSAIVKGKKTGKAEGSHRAVSRAAVVFHLLAEVV